MDIVAVIGGLVVSEGATSSQSIIQPPSPMIGTEAPIWTTHERANTDAAFAQVATTAMAPKHEPSLAQLCITLSAGMAALHSIAAECQFEKEHQSDDPEGSSNKPNRTGDDKHAPAS